MAVLNVLDLAGLILLYIAYCRYSCSITARLVAILIVVLSAIVGSLHGTTFGGDAWGDSALESSNNLNVDRPVTFYVTSDVPYTQDDEEHLGRDLSRLGS